MAKGGQHFNFNLPDIPDACIDKLPQSGIAIYRGSPDRAVDFCEALRAKLSEYEWGDVTFDNIDVSQVEWNALNFSVLLEVLQEKGISTKRLKAFKCGLDDECVMGIGAWMEALPAEGMPSEIHLSNNRITQEGFDTLFQVLESKRTELAEQAVPVWVRVENNQVDQANLEELCTNGKVVKCAGIRDRQPGQAVMAMPSFQTGKGGGGAARWSSAAPQVVSPKGAKGGWQTSPWGGGKDSQWGGGRSDAWPGGAWGACGGSSWDTGSWSPGHATPAVQALPAPRVLPPRSFGKGVPSAIRPPASYNNGGVQAQARVSAAADRSRTPVARTPVAPRNPPESGPKLLPGWSKEWSEEYQIPYFWNKDTGDSLWEAPTS